MKKIRVLCALIVFGIFFWLLPSAGEAATISVSCGAQSLQTNGINVAASGDTILVTGICNENIDIPKSVTINGSGTAVIHGPDDTQPTVKIRAGSVTIKNHYCPVKS